MITYIMPWKGLDSNVFLNSRCVFPMPFYSLHFHPQYIFKLKKTCNFIFLTLSENFVNNKAISVLLPSTLQSRFQECSLMSWFLTLWSTDFVWLVLHGLQVCVSCSVMSNSLRPHGLQLARLLYSWDSPGKNSGVSCHSVLQGIFPTQGSNLGLLYCRWIIYRLRHQGEEFK